MGQGKGRLTFFRAAGSTDGPKKSEIHIIFYQTEADSQSEDFTSSYSSRLAALEAH
jgi:hypothetical protein